MKALIAFLRDERGQDLIEYTLLVAFIAVGSALIFSGAGSSTKTIWNDAKATLSNAAVTAS